MSYEQTIISVCTDRFTWARLSSSVAPVNTYDHIITNRNVTNFEPVVTFQCDIVKMHSSEV